MSTEAPPDRAGTANGAERHGGHLHAWVLPVRPAQPVNPALLKHARERADYAQNRVADHITTFAGSMAFVYLHVAWFGLWIGLGVESYPYGLLTMIVSLEAIFLSTFVMISQNRAEAKRQVIADAQWRTVQEEDRQNLELLKLSGVQQEQNDKLLKLSEEILALTKQSNALAGKAEENNRQNKQLLDLSKRVLAATEEIRRGTS